MAGSKSNYLENALLDHALGGPDYVRPANIWIALYLEAPNDAGGGLEVSGGSYYRPQLPNDLSTWAAAIGGSKTNLVEVVFPLTSAAWGLVVAYAIHDDPVAGNMLYWGEFDDPPTVGIGSTAKFVNGALTVQED